MSEELARYDVCLIGARRSMRVSPQGVRALITWMAGSGYLGDVLQTEAKDWTEVHAEAGTFGHALFHAGENTMAGPAFLELGVRFGSVDLHAGYDIQEPVYFFFELRGAAFDDVTDELLERVDSILYARPEVWVKPHEGLRARDVGEEPETPQPRRADRVDGRTGVRVEEL